MTKNDLGFCPPSLLTADSPWHQVPVPEIGSSQNFGPSWARSIETSNIISCDSAAKSMAYFTSRPVNGALKSKHAKQQITETMIMTPVPRRTNECLWVICSHVRNSANQVTCRRNSAYYCSPSRSHHLICIDVLNYGTGGAYKNIYCRLLVEPHARHRNRNTWKRPWTKFVYACIVVR